MPPHNFSTVPRANIQRSSFNRSHGYKTTFDAGNLVPIFLDEGLPGDTFNLSMTAFARLATPINPIMDNVYLDTFFFAVPLRLIWDNFPKFMGEQTSPGDSTDYLVPTMTSPSGNGYTIQTLQDYLGLPTGIADLEHSALPTRAYNLIYNEWFRDENIQDPQTTDKGDGPDDPLDYNIRKRGKRHDYFTSALPFPQKGPSVLLPLGERADVKGIGKQNQVYGSSSINIYETGNLVPTLFADASDLNIYMQEDVNQAGFPDIYADLSTATAATINQIRQAFQIQKLYERDARGGTRYTEIIQSHFGVTSPDARLNRPEYLGGGSTPVIISPIAQTSSTDATTPQGNLSAFGTVNLTGHGFTKSFTEHVIIIGLVSARADLTYQQGLNRMFSRQTRFDYFWPSLANIGEQAILNKEIFADASPTDELVFGYQERYAEYRYKPSQITGKLRSSAASSLDNWHLAQDFATVPFLNPGFIQEDPPIDRIVAVPSEPDFIYDSYIRLTTARPMPINAVPGLIDHF